MSNINFMEKYLTPIEVATVLRVTPRSVYGWLESGRLEAYRPAGRWLITPAQVEKFVKGGSSVAAPVADLLPVAAEPVPVVAAPAASRPNANPLVNRKKRGR